ncbi:MAG: SpoIIE family protein phosphatase [Bdellovibrionales bacterium]|nr:SpoIIE family protein phosphatase [Bdellovibrionales bacterium]
MAVKSKVQFPIRLKLILLLISVPLVSLSLFAYYTLSLFKEDKLAYVYDSTMKIAQATARQVETHLAAVKRQNSKLLDEVAIQKLSFIDSSTRLLDELKFVEFVYLYQIDSKGITDLRDSKIRFPREIEKVEIEPETLSSILNTAKEGQLVLRKYELKKNFYIAAEAIKTLNPDLYLIVLVVFRSSPLYETFALAGQYQKYMISLDGDVLVTPSIWPAPLIPLEGHSDGVFKKVAAKRFPEGVTEMKNEKLPTVLVAYSTIQDWGVRVITTVNQDRAFANLNALINQSVLYGAAAILLVIFIGYLVSRGLTGSLNKLVKATEDISRGEFDTKVNIKTSDEVGYLANRVEWMAGQVHKLVNETAEKSRLENEIETVKLVQDKLIPPWEVLEKDFHLCSYIEPAEVCGGDWFDYHFTEDKVRVIVGDATGHGAGPAMLTAAAKSVGHLCITDMSMDPATAIETMNRAIYSVSQGSIQMTLFFGEIDRKTGVVRYANAGHEFPIVIPKKDKVKKKDLDYFLSDSSQRLGQSADAKYENKEAQIQPFDQILFFTDGVFEVSNPLGEELSEGSFLRTLAKLFSGEAGVQKKLGDLNRELRDFRSDTPLPDDVTLVACQFLPQQEA